MLRHITIFAALTAMIPVTALAETHHVEPGEGAQERLQEALIIAAPGDIVEMGEGVFALTDGLSLDVDGVTLRGAGMDKTVLDFAGQQGAGEGLLVTSDNVILRDFAVRDSKGDGIKSKGADNIVYHRLTVEWSGDPKPTNGAYGVYPVESENVLVDGVIVRGASDAGIYVGQSRNIIVRNSIAEFNVAGIEIENSYRADVMQNIARHNTGGILVFDLPNLPQQGGHDVRVFNNVVESNDTDNFAPAGNIVASVPTGTGVMVMANRNVEIFENVLTGNGSSNIMVIGYRQPFEDPNYQPMIRDVRISGNQHGEAGFAPDFDGGALLAAAFGGTLPPIIWDGAGGAGANVVSSDPVPVLTLGLDRPDQPISEARPGLAEMTGDAAPTIAAVVLPDAMELAVQDDENDAEAAMILPPRADQLTSVE